MSTLGSRIKSAREAANLYQDTLAEMIDVKSASVISNWENDNSKPDAEKLVRLCKALGVSLSYLLDYSGRDSFSVSPSEKELVTKFRAMSDRDQETIRLLVDRFCEK